MIHPSCVRLGLTHPSLRSCESTDPLTEERSSHSMEIRPLIPSARDCVLTARWQLVPCYKCMTCMLEDDFQEADLAPIHQSG